MVLYLSNLSRYYLILIRTYEYDACKLNNLDNLKLTKTMPKWKYYNLEEEHRLNKVKVN